MDGGLSGSFSRLNARERTLVISLVGVLAMLLAGGGIWYVRNKLHEKEERIRANQTSWRKIQALSGPYLEAVLRAQETETRIKENKYARNPDDPVAAVAVQSKVRYIESSQPEQEGQMHKLLTTTGELHEKQLTGGKRRKQRKGPVFFRVEKQFKMSRQYVHTDDLWNFLGQLEGMDNLVYVTRLTINRSTRDPDFAQIKNLTASTLRWVEMTEEE